MTRRALVIWCAIVPIAILNGALRDLFIVPQLGSAAAHVISTIALCVAILALAWIAIGWIRPVDGAGAMRIGAGWLTLTVAFEFLAGHFVFGTPWSRLAADYNVAEGRVWILVLLTTAVAPWLAALGRHVIASGHGGAGTGRHMRPFAGGAS